MLLFVKIGKWLDGRESFVQWNKNFSNHGKTGCAVLVKRTRTSLRDELVVLRLSRFLLLLYRCSTVLLLLLFVCFKTSPPSSSSCMHMHERTGMVIMVVFFSFHTGRPGRWRKRGKCPDAAAAGAVAVAATCTGFVVFRRKSEKRQTELEHD